MMRQILTYSLAFISLLVLGSCNAKKGIVQTKESNADLTFTPAANSLLWKIEGKGVKGSSYLFGTVHIIDEDKFFWPKGTLAAIDETETMIFEIDMDDMTDISAQLSMIPAMMMKGGTTLKDLLNDEEYELIRKHFDERGIPMMMIERMKPMVASAMAELDMDEVSMGVGSMKSYEFEFYELATSKEMEIEGLESMEYQIGLFDSIPYDVQAKMLVEAINSEPGTEMFDELMGLYVDQDVEAMYSYMSAEDEDFRRILLYNRNSNWIPIMREKMKEGPIFFAVGAGHLGGERGVIHLLKKAGYTLTPMSL